MRAVQARPGAGWIEQLRRRYPVEAELDRVLTRKLQRRAGPGQAPLQLAELCSGLESLLRARLPERFEVAEPRWLSGGASKLQMAFTLDWNAPGAGRRRTPMVLRMQPEASLIETSRLREFQLIRAFQGVIPVPPVYWVDAQAEHLPQPALVYGFVPGVTKPTASSSNVSGMGTRLPPALRERLAPQFVEYLVRIHTHDPGDADLSAFERPAPGTHCAELGLNWWTRVWEEDFEEDEPLMRVAEHWLRRHMPPVERPGLTHGDYRIGNFLFTEDDARICAWLDWELGRIGDRHEDLAWTTSRTYAQYAEDGRTLLACGLLPAEALFEAYEKRSGLAVNLDAIRYYQLYNYYKSVVMAKASAYRAASGGKTHQDILLAWIIGLVPMLLDELRRMLEELG